MPRPSPAGGTANCVLARAGRGSPEQRNEASSPRGTESLRTRRWRKPDSNHRSRVTRPSFRRRLISLAWLPTRGKVGANENRYYEDAGRLPRNRWFESGFLQQRVVQTSFHVTRPRAPFGSRLFARARFHYETYMRGDAVRGSSRKKMMDEVLSAGRAAEPDPIAALVLDGALDLRLDRALFGPPVRPVRGPR